MSFKLHRNKWKGVRWIDTHFADGHKKKMIIARSLTRLSLVIGLARISRIKASSATTTEDKIKKSVALVRAYIDTAEEIKNTLALVMGSNRKEKEFSSALDDIAKEVK